MTKESPMTYPIEGAWSEAFKDFFTTTMTYRHDSDVVVPYSRFEIIPGSNPPTEPPQNANLSELSQATLKLSHRPKQVLWLVSNCHPSSLRDHYVSELRKFINVSFAL